MENSIKLCEKSPNPRKWMENPLIHDATPVKKLGQFEEVTNVK
jgi:hypothetical protein